MPKSLGNSRSETALRSYCCSSEPRQFAKGSVHAQSPKQMGDSWLLSFNIRWDFIRKKQT